MLKRIMSGHGEQATLGERSGFLFTAQEVYEAHSLLFLPILFRWDALWVLNTADYVVSIEHHGRASVTSRNKVIADELRTRLKDWLTGESKQAHRQSRD